jgi:hypothetical protein
MLFTVEHDFNYKESTICPLTQIHSQLLTNIALRIAIYHVFFTSNNPCP